jgi:hypothetical protein
VGPLSFWAAWDGLTIESQIELLVALNQGGHSDFLAKKILRKALESPNAYIRYLAGIRLRDIIWNNEDQIWLKERIAADPDELVRNCLLENEWNFLDEDLSHPPAFWGLPHAARLAKVRRLRGGGEKIVSLITYGVENLLPQEKISEMELHEILADYLISPSFHDWYGKNHFYDGWAEHQAENDIAAFWQLVTKVPEQVSYVLLLNLPERIGDRGGAEIPKAVLEQLSVQQLETLLFRNDVQLTRFRKGVFYKSLQGSSDLRNAAISSNFNLQYREFRDILKKSDDKKMPILKDLASMAGDLSLVLYEALHDILSVEYGEGWEESQSAFIAMGHKVKALEGAERQSQLTELKLYELAKQAAPWNREETGFLPSGKLEFLASATVKGDTWQTFMNYSTEWANVGGNHQRELANYLPRLLLIEEEEEEKTVEQGQTEEGKQPLSREEFFCFHAQQVLNRRLGLYWWGTFIFFVGALYFGSSAISGVFSGSQESLGSDIGLTFVMVFGMIVCYRGLKLWSEQKPFWGEKANGVSQKNPK